MAGICFAVERSARSGTDDRKLNGRATDTSSPDFLCRNRTSFRQQGHADAQTRARRYRHRLPADGPGHRDSGDGQARVGVSLRHGARDGRRDGRDGRAPAGRPGQRRHRQRRRRAQSQRSADHGRQRGAVPVSGAGSRHQAAVGAAALHEDPAAGADRATATSASRFTRPITSRSATRSASTIRCCGTSRAPSGSPSRASPRASPRRARSAS